MTTDPHHQDTDVAETLKSLIVAFVLAMTFRAFVTEGFVIPTGSMAPTLMGQHVRFQSPTTGVEYPVGFDVGTRRSTGLQDPSKWSTAFSQIADPMLGPDHFGGTGVRLGGKVYPSLRSGDRILVHKSLYPFTSPNRYDVVVFKNPTNPNGDDGNYIKRLIGLPDESVWIVNGDIFAAPADRHTDWDEYRIQRKPDHVQRAVWQAVYRSAYIPNDRGQFRSELRDPWTASTEAWDITGRAFRCSSADPSLLEWNQHVRPTHDWLAYNSIRETHATRVGRTMLYRTVHDLRIAGTVVPDSEGLATTLDLWANGHQFLLEIADGQARVRQRAKVWDADDRDLDAHGWTESEPVSVDPIPAGKPTKLEFWHVDQRLVLFIDGDKALEYEYDWRPIERLRHSVSESEPELSELAKMSASEPPQIRWRFSGAPLSLYRVELDRDLFYRIGDQRDGAPDKNPSRNPDAGGDVGSRKRRFGTHPENLALLGSDQFFMLGDNSSASSDSRMWGYPHPLVAEQIDAAPFIVHRRLLLGKAWVVYFPSPLPMKEGGSKFIPDFGRLRFIR